MWQKDAKNDKKMTKYCKKMQKTSNKLPNMANKCKKMPKKAKKNPKRLRNYQTLKCQGLVPVPSNSGSELAGSQSVPGSGSELSCPYGSR